MRMDTYKWDSPSGEAVNWFAAWCYTDENAELIAKVIRKVRPKGKFTDATLSVFGITPDTEIDVGDLTTGANALVNISLADSTEIKQYAISKVRCKNLLMDTVRISGTSTDDGTGVIDQIHEIAVLYDVTSQER